MENPDRPSTPEHAERQRFQLNHLDSLQQTAGPVFPGLPDQPSEENFLTVERHLTGDNIFESFNEQYRYNEVLNRRHALLREAALQDPDKQQQVDREELIVINQAVTYHEYVPRIVNHMIDSMRRYESLRRQVTAVPPELALGERQAELYMAALNQALQERVAFANLTLIDGQLMRHQGDQQELMRLREEYTKNPALSATSQRAIAVRYPDALWRQSNLLNQRIIDILAGRGGIQGVPEGFVPQGLYLDLLKSRYQELLDEQKHIIRDPSLKKARMRHDELDEMNDRAREGKGDALTESEAKEYASLKQQITDRNGLLAKLGTERHKISETIVSFTSGLGDVQIQHAEVTTIQHQFGDKVDFSGASAPSPDSTPPFIRKAVAEQMEARSNFHLDRMDGFLRAVDTNVLDPGLSEYAEDMWNKNGREVVRRIALRLADAVTFPIPETMGIRAKARESLVGPLQEALGWPAGKERWEDLTSDEKERVQHKANGVLDAMKAFDRTTIVRLQDNITALRGMEPASAYVSTEVKEPLPAERVTPANRQELITRYGGATVYAMLFHQMDADWGDEGSSGSFMHEYAQFFGKVNDVVDVHLDVGDALHQMSQSYWDMAKYLAYAAGLVFVGGVVGAGVMYKIMKGSVRMGLKGTKAAVRQTTKVVRGAPAEATAAASRVGGVLGIGGHILMGAGEAWTAWEIKEAVTLANSMQALPERTGVIAALELLETHPSIDRSAPRYQEEVSLLRHRVDVLEVRDVLIILIKRIRFALRNQQISAAQKKFGEELIDRAEPILEEAEKENDRLHGLFPIDDYLRKSSRDPTDVIRVMYGKLDEARRRGIAFGRNEALLSTDLLTSQSPVQSLSDRYSTFLREYPAFRIRSLSADQLKHNQTLTIEAGEKMAWIDGLDGYHIVPAKGDVVRPEDILRINNPDVPFGLGQGMYVLWRPGINPLHEDSVKRTRGCNLTGGIVITVRVSAEKKK